MSKQNEKRFYPYCNYCKQRAAGHKYKYCKACNQKISREVNTCWSQFRPFEQYNKEY